MQQTANYFDLVSPTYLENWPSELGRLSIAQKDIPLSRDEAVVLGHSIKELGEVYFEKHFTGLAVDPQKILSSLVLRMGAAAREFPNGVFVRLGSRSPKDSWLGHREGFQVMAGIKAITLLTDCSERMAEDLFLALTNNYLPHIFLRQWLDIEPWQEFRCFMKDRKLIGISQYNYLEGECFKEIVEHKGGIRWAIEMFFDRLRQACHLDDVVFDVITTKRSRENEIQWEVKLLEINPFMVLTDPCLYDWNKPGEFDGSIRIIGEDGAQIRNRDIYFHDKHFFGLLEQSVGEDKKGVV